MRGVFWRVSFAVIVACFLSANLPGYAWENPATGSVPTVVWYIPHPDDETIGMAGAISASIKAGNRNIFVFLTQGGNTLVRQTDGNDFGFAMDASRVKAARVREATEALLTLGAQPDNILFLDYDDGSLTLQQALGVIRLFRMAYPSAAHRTVSVYDTHPDHKILATALSMVAEESGNRMDVAFYRIYIYREPPAERIKEHVLAERVPDKKLKQRAIAEYRTYDPTTGRYGIGGRSVPDMLNAAANDSFEYRDIEPVSLQGFRSAHIMLEKSSLSIGTVYRFSNPNWELIVNGDVSPDPGVTVHLAYNLKNLPALAHMYFGGAYQIRLTNQGAYVFVGAAIIDVVYAEYRKPVNGSGENPRFYWGVRWNWP